MTDRDIERLIDFIDERIAMSVNRSSLTVAPEKPLKLIGAVVVSATSTTATVTLAGNDSNITIPIVSGLTLATNDRVEVLIKNGNYTNAFVAFKLQ